MYDMLYYESNSFKCQLCKDYELRMCKDSRDDTLNIDVQCIDSLLTEVQLSCIQLPHMFSVTTYDEFRFGLTEIWIISD